MELDEVKRLLEESGYEIEEEKRLGNDTGTQLILSSEEKVNVYDTGTVNVQGRGDPQAIKDLLGITGTYKITKKKGTPKTKHALPKEKPRVFVVYGHDRTARDQLEAMLRRWDLEPLILDQLPSEGQTVIEKLESYTTDVSFGIVLATPDDEGYRRGRTDEKALRARQNVVLELGMLLAKLGRKKVAILLKDQENMERPSDIQGLIYIPFKDDLPKEAGLNLAKELSAAGYPIDVSKV